MRLARSIGVVSVLSIVMATDAVAQTCIGYPAQQTGNFNLTLNGTVGQEFGGGGGHVNLSLRTTGPFLGLGAGANRYVVEPKETRVGFGGVFGWERYSKDQLIWCPIITVEAQRGSEVDRGDEGLQRTNALEYGIGLGLGFEVERRGPLSYNPFLMARFTQHNAHVEGTVVDSTARLRGVVFGVGLGLRINDAIQITPSFNGSTFDDATLFFDVRFSMSFRLR